MGTHDKYFNSEEAEEVVRRGEEKYKKFAPEYCPYFKEKVHFNSQGLEHLKFKNRERPRSLKDQHMRFKLLHLAPEVIKESRTLQGILETKKFERVRVHGRTDTVLKVVIFYEFIAVIKRNRIKVIVKEIDKGEKFFWSLIPFWGMNEQTMQRILHEGNPAED